MANEIFRIKFSTSRVAQQILKSKAVYISVHMLSKPVASASKRRKLLAPCSPSAKRHHDTGIPMQNIGGFPRCSQADKTRHLSGVGSVAHEFSLNLRLAQAAKTAANDSANPNQVIA